MKQQSLTAGSAHRPGTNSESLASRNVVGYCCARPDQVLGEELTHGDLLIESEIRQTRAVTYREALQLLLAGVTLPMTAEVLEHLSRLVKEDPESITRTLHAIFFDDRTFHVYLEEAGDED